MEALGVSLPGLATQLVSFLVLFALLHRLLYKPIIKILDQRSQRIKESLETAENIKREAAESKEAMQLQVVEARAEGQAMIAQAREVADRFKEEELAKARDEIVAERRRAEIDIQRERDVAIEELRTEFADLAITAAERLTRRSLDHDAHEDLISQVLKEASSSSSVKD